MSAIILESSLVHYEALGRGRPLLFLHGWLGSWRYWVPTMVELSSSYRAYALDFWGFGDSDRVTGRYDISGYVAQVESFLDQMGIGRVPIIGHGLGGVVAICFARDHVDRVDQVMAVSVPLSAEGVARPLAGYAGGANPAKAILGRRLRFYEEVEMEATKTDGEAVARSVRSTLKQDLVGALREQQPPVLLVSGQDDPIISPPDERTLAAFRPNVYSFVFDGAQHYPMLDEANKFSRLLRDFLTYRDDWGQIQIKDEWKRRMR